MKKAGLFLIIIFFVLHATAQNVGIGTANPARMLHIRDSVSGIANLLMLQGNDPYISFYDNTGNYKSYIWDVGQQLQIGTAGSTSSISLNPGFSANTTFLSNGKVGIGTATPDARLQIEAGATDEVLRMNSTGFPYLSLQKSGTPAALFGLVQGDGFTIPEHLQVAVAGTRTMRFVTGGAVRMEIKQTNLVNIGASGDPVSLDVYGYTRLGDPSLSPRIQVIKLAGATALTQGGIAQIVHGITDPTKILGVTVLVQNPSGEHIPPHHTTIIGREFDYLVTNTYIEIYNHPSNSSFILNRPVKILVTMEE